MQCKGNRTRCMEYHDGQCLSLGNCMYQGDEEKKEVKQRKILDIKIDDRIKTDKDIDEILLHARDIVASVYEYFEKINKYNEAFKQIDNTTVSLLTENGNLVNTDDTLSSEQQEEISYTIRQMIKCNIAEAAEQLNMLYVALSEIQNGVKK